ncbi:peptide-methionine (S)-S-oxide reductase [Parapedobacter luteus]|uniref:Peptide methionine sulfoxide reductase MsrA n=1 Tax=Parapedobacter luteus TaxID=623280 RepID=A0A1T5BHX5_9SPHI|nr:peptide-methionine (S)-S-oxide reductase MsrA [Parapedobacter luteus]SKB46609.1 peptide-methionine (S)-S-oxide reductase [Parapedobacter luteus]
MKTTGNNRSGAVIGGCFALLLLVSPIISRSEQQKDDNNTTSLTEPKVMEKENAIKTDTATFAAGCFWCVEEQFKQLKGVESVTSGYTGGTVPDPTYKEVGTGTTGHAEACNIVFDPAKISYEQLMEAFFVAHDPTQLNRQGNDVGTQYRSAIFYHNAKQQKLATYYIKRLNEEKAYEKNIVTQVMPYGMFYKAEDYHQDYYANNSDAPYCQLVIKPKLEKFKKVFKHELKYRKDTR